MALRYYIKILADVSTNNNGWDELSQNIWTNLLRNELYDHDKYKIALETNLDKIATGKNYSFKVADDESPAVS